MIGTLISRKSNVPPALQVSGAASGKDHRNVNRRMAVAVRDARAVRRGVVDHRDRLRLRGGGEIARDRRALLVVAADGAERHLEPLLGELRVRRRAGDHRDAGLVVDVRGRDGRAGVEVADDTGDFRIDELLRDRGPDLGIGLVVFGDEHELRLLAVDRDLRRVRLVDREARAVLVVLAQVRDAAGERRHVADQDRDARGRRSLRGFCRLALFLAARSEPERGDDGESDRSHVSVHVVLSMLGNGGR